MRLTYCFFICFFCFGMPAFCDVMSKYGQIQNVQTYSANPFYNPNGSYNQNFPRLVYANGNDVENADCNRIVLGLLQSYCGTRNGCNGMQLSDVRPTIMVQLSQIPNHNYAVACSGFLDTVFAVYMSEQSNGIQRVNFPTVKKSAVEFSFGDDVPDWESEYKEREMELEQLQSQNAGENGNLTATQFPRTIDDISLQDKMALMGDGLKPYKDNHAYMQLGDVMEDWAAYTQRLEKARKEAEEKKKKEEAEKKSEFDPGGADNDDDGDGSRENDENDDECYDVNFFRKTQLNIEQGKKIAEWYLEQVCGAGWKCGGKIEKTEYNNDFLQCEKSSHKVMFEFDDLKEWKYGTKVKSLFYAVCKVLDGEIKVESCSGIDLNCSIISEKVRDFSGHSVDIQEIEKGNKTTCKLIIS